MDLQKALYLILMSEKFQQVRINILFAQTCQVSVLRMSEKFVEPPKSISCMARKIFLGLGGVWGMLPQKNFENYVSKIG